MGDALRRVHPVGRLLAGGPTFPMEPLAGWFLAGLIDGDQDGYEEAIIRSP